MALTAIPSGDEVKQDPVCSLEPHGLKHQTNIKRLSFDFLFDTDNKQSDPIHRSPVRSESRF